MTNTNFILTMKKENTLSGERRFMADIISYNPDLDINDTSDSDYDFYGYLWVTDDIGETISANILINLTDKGYDVCLQEGTGIADKLYREGLCETHEDFSIDVDLSSVNDKRMALKIIKKKIFTFLNEIAKDIIFNRKN